LQLAAVCRGGFLVQISARSCRQLAANVQGAAAISEGAAPAKDEDVLAPSYMRR
jgi:hypothetical protein